SREFALRSALGAARTRIIRQLLAESVLLSSAGGALGALLAVWAVRAVPSITAYPIPRSGEIHLDWFVLGFTAALSLATGVLFGLAPSLGASRPDLMSVLRASGDLACNANPKRILAALNIRGLLVVGQIALSMVLLIGAALLVETIAHLRNVHAGFNPAHLLTLRISLPPSRYDTDQKRIAFYEGLVRTAEASPGFHGVSAAGTLPMMPYPGTPVQDAAQPRLKLNERPIEAIVSITPGYFRTLEIALKRGREFGAQDKADSQRVTIIDENLARQFWPGYPNGDNPIGKRLLIGGVNPNPAEIVGVVANVRQRLQGNAWPGTVYVPFTQGSPQSAIFAIRTAGDPLGFTSAIREHVRRLDRDQPIANVQTMEALVEAQVGQPRLLMRLLESFAGVALLLALIGIYGVIAYSVAQRTQEVGIRRALGASQIDILWVVIKEGIVL